MVVSFFFDFIPAWANDPISRSYFSNGLVQPPTRKESTKHGCLLGKPCSFHPEMGMTRVNADFFRNKSPKVN